MNYIPLSEVERFDMLKKPQPISWYLRPVTWLISFPTVWLRHDKITKINMDGLKPPYVLLCNHNAFMDFMVATVATFPHKANYLVAIDGFIGREGLMRKVGCICKRKFTNDALLVRQIQRVINSGNIAAIYPEARYSLCGTNAILPESLGRLAKFLKVPVVTLITKGHHINSPFWNLHKRKNRVEATLTQLITKEELATLSNIEIFERISEAFIYDDYKWQKENKICIKYKDRAKGLHKVLYQCPNCKTEYKMDSGGTKIWCNNCGKQWEMNEFSELSAIDCNTEFSHIPDWYEWEREQVKNEVINGVYNSEFNVTVKSLPNSKGFVDLGDAKLYHNMDGFLLTGTYEGNNYTFELKAQATYSCHIEYDYLGKYGDCVDLNTLNDTYYIFPKGNDFSVTKMSLATEELYNYYHNLFEKENTKTSK